MFFDTTNVDQNLTESLIQFLEVANKRESDANYLTSRVLEVEDQK